jgi:hypothetical protein
MFKQRTNLPLVTLDKPFDRWLILEAEVINYGHAKYSRPEIKGSRPICKSIKSHLARDGYHGALPGAVAIDSCEVAPDFSGVLAHWG